MVPKCHSQELKRVLGSANRFPVQSKVQSLAVALQKDRLGGAALDVLSTEPPPPDHPLRQAPNVILTPHLAFYSRQSVIELQTKAAEEVARALKGEPPRSPVNSEVLAR